MRRIRSLNVARVSSSLSLSPCFRRIPKSFSYRRLPSHHDHIKLSVLKLDGSFFEVEVARKARISELKREVEDVFYNFPNERQSNISWSHVWGHFCLSYKGLKLIDDKVQIRNLGIKDGDQLRFMRHLSMEKDPSMRRFSFRHRHSASGHEQLVM
ncbi:SNRNP25, ubiquitin-like domain [Dillenia turbinata]|uniref:SNRNP25, ubiquitin-like domain n=1 Tax=Dillenia turbinata TaxID=194707 RepID=A0AAN8ZPA6_9MAGN